MPYELSISGLSLEASISILKILDFMLLRKSELGEKNSAPFSNLRSPVTSLCSSAEWLERLFSSKSSEPFFVINFLPGEPTPCESTPLMRECNKASNADLPCWMDLRGLLKEPTVEVEMELWHVIINDVKLNVSPGSSFHCTEPGWFRVCFANMDSGTMEVALWRIHNFMLHPKEVDVPVKNKSWLQNNLREI
uniref:1-aminocyclopropane-1-carboxylate synthase n=1 Tax=Nelumbo nucifera TaxID=4432 RepID=A0A822YKX8_NELNU|nr:TPA_asm: hypothetical protein HUJ06_012101 [Nelumbo nucifera]